jgi:hypothetical protein
MSADLQLAIVASLLRRGKAFDRLSTGLTLLGLVAGITQLWIIPTTALLPVLVLWIVICGVIEKYYDFRVAFDAELFTIAAADINRTAEFDQAMSTLGLLPVDKTGRSWDSRSRGALKLLRLQTLFVTLQLLALLAALSIFPWLPSA